MKTVSKVGLIGAVAALAVLAGAAPAIADSSDNTQDVTGTLDATMAVTVPGPASITLAPGSTATVPAGSVVVHSNVAYDLEVSDENNGELTDSGNSHTLGSPLSVSSTTLASGATATADATSLVGSSTAPVTLGSKGGAADPSGDSYDVTLSQPVAWSDAVSSASGYTDTLTYTVAAPVA